MEKNIFIIFLLLIIVGLSKIGLDALQRIVVSTPMMKTYTVDFDKEIDVADGVAFGPDDAFTFELFRNGTFVIDTHAGVATQISDHYGDSAIVRGSQPLPDVYTVRVKVGQIHYGLENIAGLAKDPNYREGPLNENGCYLLAITDEKPSEHYTNDWWHRHRKLVIDVDNNVWGHGMPNPIFMVYFDKGNQLVAYDGERDQWGPSWERAYSYVVDDIYIVELQKTLQEYIFSLYDASGGLLERAAVNLDEVWHGSGRFPEYFVFGDPHENYYQGSVKFYQASISF